MGMVKRCCGRAQQRKGEFMIRITQLKLAYKKQPSIIFIDEIDSILSKRR